MLKQNKARIQYKPITINDFRSKKQQSKTTENIFFAPHNQGVVGSCPTGSTKSKSRQLPGLSFLQDLTIFNLSLLTSKIHLLFTTVL